MSDLVGSVTDADFQSTVLTSDKPVLVDFWASWCAPCRMIAPVVEDIANEMGDRVTVLKMDIDANPRVPSALQIMSIPTVIIFKDGQIADRTIGYRPSMKGDLKEKLTRLAPAPS